MAVHTAKFWVKAANEHAGGVDVVYDVVTEHLSASISLNKTLVFVGEVG